MPGHYKPLQLKRSVDISKLPLIVLKIKYIGLPISAWSGKCKQVQTLESFSHIFCCLNFPKCYPNRSACENENISGSLTFLIQSLCDDGCDSRSADILLHSQSGSTVVVSAFENALFSYRCQWSLMAAPIILHSLAVQSWFSNFIIMIHLQSTFVLLTVLPVCFQWTWNCNVSYRGMLHLVTFYCMLFSDPEP